MIDHDSARPSAFSLHRQTTLLIFILLIAAIFRFWNLDHWSLWADELYTWKLVPELRILNEGIPDDQHPPLYHIMLHYLIQFNDSEVWLRLPSAIAGIVTIPLMWQIGVVLNRRKIGFVAAALLALSPIHIWYSREARMYALGLFLATASLLFYIRILQRDALIDTLGLTIFTLAGILTTYSMLGLWGIELGLFWLLWHLSGQKPVRLARWLAAQLLIILGFAWWWPKFHIQLNRSGVFNWTIAPLGLNLTSTMADTIRLALVGLVVVILAGIGAWLIVRWRPQLWTLTGRRTSIIAAGVTVLFILATAAGAVPRGLSIRRQLLVFWPLPVLAAAWALVRLQKRGLMTAVLILSFILAVLSLAVPSLEDWRGAADWLTHTAQPGDKILVTPNWAAMGFDYYYHGQLFYQGAAPANDQPPGAPGDHVWLVVRDAADTRRQTEPVIAWFETHAEQISVQPFPRLLKIIEYRVR